MRTLLLGVATAALALTPALADPGNGKGNGGQGHGNGGAKVSGNGNRNAPAQSKQNWKPQKAAAPQREMKVQRQVQPAMREQVNPMRRVVEKPGNGPMHVSQDNGKPVKFDKKGQGQRVEYRDSGNTVRIVSDRNDGRDSFRWSSLPTYRTGSFEGCPPGLAKKGNGCLPPGLANKVVSRTVFYDRPSWYGYDPAPNYQYRYYDGYMLRMNSGGSVLGYLPLLGGALSIGQVWPAVAQPIQLPTYYVDYYGLQPSGYRYYDDTIYRVDPETQAIRAIAALLTGQDFIVGQRMPVGYDVYNVPYPYRDRYYDTPDYHYRYSDGYVYQVDPKTQLIMAAIEMLT